MVVDKYYVPIAPNSELFKYVAIEYRLDVR